MALEVPQHPFRMAADTAFLFIEVVKAVSEPSWASGIALHKVLYCMPAVSTAPPCASAYALTTIDAFVLGYMFQAHIKHLGSSVVASGVDSEPLQIITAGYHSPLTEQRAI